MEGLRPVHQNVSTVEEYAPPPLRDELEPDTTSVDGPIRQTELVPQAKEVLAEDPVRLAALQRPGRKRPQGTYSWSRRHSLKQTNENARAKRRSQQS